MAGIPSGFSMKRLLCSVALAIAATGAAHADTYWVVAYGSSGSGARDFWVREAHLPAYRSRAECERAAKLYSGTIASLTSFPPTFGCRILGSPGLRSE